MRHQMISGVAAAAFIALCGSAANAADVTLDFAGTSGYGAYTAEVMLDVVGGQAMSGTGTLSGAGFTGTVPVTLITSTTSGVEGPSGGTFGYRFNDGTDIFGVDTAVPIDQNGLLFYLRDGPISPGSNGGFAVSSNGDGTYSSFFADSHGPNAADNYGGGLTTVTEVSSAPEPSVWALMMAGLALVGTALRFRKRQGGPVLGAA